MEQREKADRRTVPHFEKLRRKIEQITSSLGEEPESLSSKAWRRQETVMDDADPTTAIAGGSIVIHKK